MEIDAEQAKNVCRNYLRSEQTEEQEIAGIITDKDEAMDFLQWLMSSEAREIGRQLREKKGVINDQH